jgi:hypothetical protein
MDIKFDITGLDNVQTFLRSLSGDVLDTVLKAYGEYLVGDQSHGLKHYSPYEYVARSEVYSPPFVSDRQRRFVMAMISEGKIDPGTPHRTGELQRGWELHPQGDVAYIITNSVPYAGYVVGDESQSAMAKRGGWRTVSQNVKDNAAGAFRAAVQALNKLIKSKGG